MRPAAPEEDGRPDDLHAHAPDETGEIVSREFNGVTHRLAPAAWIEAPPQTRTYLVEGVNASTAVADTRLEHTFQGEASWRPTPEDERIRYPVTLTNEVFATVFAVDLDIDSDNDGAIDDGDEGEETLPPGKVFFVNGDDDDDNGVPDKDQSGAVAGENDLVPIELEPGPSFSQTPPNSWWGLAYPEHVRVWFDADRSGLVDSGATQFWPPPDTLYVEGVAPSASAGDVTIHLVQQVYGAGPFFDKVVATVAAVDLDIDSDNNDGFAPPQRTAEEEEAEGRPAGMKVLVVGRDDQDGDDIPDYADGFGLVGGDSAVGTLNSQFAPLALRVDGVDGLGAPKVTFTYDGSDPNSVIVTQTPIPDLESGFMEYAPAPGLLRIWRKNGAQLRDPGQDYIVPGTEYDYAQFQDGNVLYVEAVNGSPTAVDITVTLTFGGNETISDTVRVLPIDAASGVEETEILGYTLIEGGGNGTPGNDIIVGTPGDDVIDAGGGADIIFLSDGQDIVTTDYDQDAVFLGDGDKELLYGPASTPPAIELDPQELQSEPRVRRIGGVGRRYRMRAFGHLGFLDKGYLDFYGHEDVWLKVFTGRGGVLYPESVVFDEVLDQENEPNASFVKRSAFDAAGNPTGFVYDIKVEKFNPRFAFLSAPVVRRELIELATANKWKAYYDSLWDQFIDDLVAGVVYPDQDIEADVENTLFVNLQPEEALIKLRVTALANANAAVTALAEAYVGTFALFSVGTDMVFVVNDLVEGDGLSAALTVIPFAGAMMKPGARAVLRFCNTLRNCDVNALVRTGRHWISPVTDNRFIARAGMKPDRRLVGTKNVFVMGTAQNPGGANGAAHASRVVLKTEELAQTGDHEFLFMARSLRTATADEALGKTAGSVGRRITDIAAIADDGSIKLVEVVSPVTQTPEEMRDKLIDIKNAMVATGYNRTAISWEVLDLDGTVRFSDIPNP